VGERDGDLPIWPIFKQTSSRDELVAHVFEYTDFAPAPNAPGEPVHRLVAIRPSGAFLEVLVVGLEKPGLLNWLGRRPTFNFVRQDPVVAKPAPEAAQGVVALSRDFVRDRLGLAVDDRAHHSAEFVK
jgi:transcriptional regulator of nitric oxide reductase